MSQIIIVMGAETRRVCILRRIMHSQLWTTRHWSQPLVLSSPA